MTKEQISLIKDFIGEHAEYKITQIVSDILCVLYKVLEHSDETSNTLLYKQINKIFKEAKKRDNKIKFPDSGILYGVQESVIIEMGDGWSDDYTAEEIFEYYYSVFTEVELQCCYSDQVMIYRTKPPKLILNILECKIDMNSAKNKDVLNKVVDFVVASTSIIDEYKEKHF